MKLYQMLQDSSLVSPETYVKIGTLYGNSFIFCGPCKAWDGNELDDFFATTALLRIRDLKTACNYFSNSVRKHVMINNHKYSRNTIKDVLFKYEEYLDSYSFLDFRDVAYYYPSTLKGIIIIIDGFEVGQYWDGSEFSDRFLLLGNGIGEAKIQENDLT